MFRLSKRRFPDMLPLTDLDKGSGEIPRVLASSLNAMDPEGEWWAKVTPPFPIQNRQIVAELRYRSASLAVASSNFGKRPKPALTEVDLFAKPSYDPFLSAP